MSPCSSVLSAKRAKFLSIAIAGILLAACSSLTPPSRIEPSPLTVASCPETLGPVRDDSFGATTEKLAEVAGVYYRCRASIFGGE